MLYGFKVSFLRPWFCDSCFLARMTLSRSPGHGTRRCLLRRTTRMLGGARRPPPPNYLALACRALEDMIRLDKSLLPFMAQQKRIVEESLWKQQCEVAIRNVYGPPDPAAPRPQYPVPSPLDIPQVLRGEQALARAQATVALLRAALAPAR